MKDYIATCKKAVAGAVSGAAIAFTAAAADGHVTLVELGGVALAAAVGFAAVWATPANSAGTPK